MIEIKATINLWLWPGAMLLAWSIGEYLFKRLGLPRISSYIVLGLLLSSVLTDSITPQMKQTLSVLTQLAFALHLFELGYRIHLRWFKTNPWVPLSGIVESLLSFALVYLGAQAMSFTYLESALMGALFMATSPSTVLQIIHQTRASGQLTERVLHHTAINLVLAVITVQLLMGVQAFEQTGLLIDALYDGFIVACISVVLGVLMGLVIPELFRWLPRTATDATLAFALGVCLLCALTMSMRLSPMLSCFVFGVVCRYQRITVGVAKQGFGTAGELLSLLLFVYVGASVSFVSLVEGLMVGVSVLLLRQLAKAIAVTSFAFGGGLQWKKGFWVSVALAPSASFLVLMAAQLDLAGFTRPALLQAVLSAALLMGVVGPLLVKLAILRSKESLIGEDG
ncbi:MAG: cation:proton antiporter [Burkholderiaceae bacterium]